jgi:hypothetical protein
MTSIACLIYRSTRYADAIWQSLHRHTPHLSDGRARFFFVANDATNEVKQHLIDKKYPHIVQENIRLTDAELDAIGIRPPEYLNRVYRGFNRALQESDEVACLISSDNLFSPGWFDALLREGQRDRVVSSKLVERKHPKFGVFPGAHEFDCGASLGSFDERRFLAFCERTAKRGTERGYAYTPSLLWRDKFVEAGMFPEGNLKVEPGDGNGYGDVEFFAKLARVGVKHLTVCDSLVYHFKEGEMSE